MADFTIGRGDLLPILTATLTGDTGAVIDLTGCTVKFNMKARSGAAVKVTAAATVVNAPGGIVSYTWAAGDTNVDGTYDAEFEVTYPSGKKLTVPNGAKTTVRVEADLG
jgi:hypothetical protein